MTTARPLVALTSAMLTLATALPAQLVAPMGLLERMVEQFHEYDSFTMDVEVESSMRGESDVFVLDIRARRPNHYYRSVIQDGSIANQVLNNADGRFQYIREIDAWETGPSFPDFKVALRRDPFSRVTFVAPFLLEDGTDVLKEYFQQVTLKETTSGADGAVHHHLEFIIDANESGTIELREADGRIMPRRLITNEPTGTAVLTFRSVKTSIETEEGVDPFAWVAPEGSQKVDSLYNTMMEYMRSQMPPPPLLGEKAPTFELRTLDGEGSVDLASHLGKEIVILDFWASWCGPCRASMPALATIASEYADKGVVLYAVNLRESPAVAQRFLDSAKLELNVLMDADGSVGDRYKAQSIPHAVIIDKEGIIQAVHVGMSPTALETYRRELDSLLAGNSLLK